MSGVDLLDDSSWQEVFTFLDGKSLLNISSTCKKFDEIFSGSVKLLEKIAVTVSYPETNNGQCKDVMEIKKRLKEHMVLTRRYQRLDLKRLRDSLVKDEKKNWKDFYAVILKLAASVKILNIDYCYLLRKDFVRTLLPFVHLQECNLTNVMFYDDVVPPDTNDFVTCPGLTSLKLEHCDFFCLLLFRACNKLKKLEISNPSYLRTDVEIFEDFLLTQTKLKELRLIKFRFNSTYSTNRLAAVPFQLEELELADVYWDITDHCEKFLTSQKSLKQLSLSGFQNWITPFVSSFPWFGRVLAHLIYNNNQLTSLNVNTRCVNLKELKHADFLQNVNKSIRDLTFLQNSPSEFFRTFARIFPNLKHLDLTDVSDQSSGNVQLVYQSFQELESLVLKMDPKSLGTPQTLPALNSYSFSSINQSKAAEHLIEIFKINPTIKHVSLSIEPLTVEEIVELFIPIASSLESLVISDLYLNETEAELFASNFPKLKKISSDCRLNPEIIEILKQKNIDFEKKDCCYVRGD